MHRVRLNDSRFRILMFISDHPGCSPTEISTWCGVSITSVSRMLRKLMDAGAVVRCKVPNDCRKRSAYYLSPGTRVYNNYGYHYMEIEVD